MWGGFREQFCSNFERCRRHRRGSSSVPVEHNRRISTYRCWHSVHTSHRTRGMSMEAFRGAADTVSGRQSATEVIMAIVGAEPVVGDMYAVPLGCWLPYVTNEWCYSNYTPLRTCGKWVEALQSARHWLRGQQRGSGGYIADMGLCRRQQYQLIHIYI